MTRPLVDSRLGKRLGPHFYDRVGTVQVATVTRGAAGSKDKAYSDDATRENLPCRISPVGGGELERSDQVLTIVTHRIALQEKHPSIVTGERFRVGSDLYDILLVQTDSADHATYLDVEVVT